MSIKRKRVQKFRMVRKLQARELSEICSQIAAMTSVGIHIGKTMEILQKGAVEPRIRKAYQKLYQLLMEGMLLSDAMEETGRFPEMVIHMFYSAEASGQLEKTAHNLAIHYQREHRLENQIRSVLLYPKILAAMSFLMLIFMFRFLIPSIQPLFEGMELPLLTRGLVWVGMIFEETWYFLFPVFLLLLMVWNMLLQNPKIRSFYEWCKFRMPIIGKQWKIIYTARFAGILSSLYGSGISLVESMELAGRTLGNRYLERQFHGVVREMKGGVLLSVAIGKVDGLDRRLMPVFYVGEETGKLDEMLDRVAENYRYEAETAMTRLAAMIEPVMILIMGFIVGLLLLGVMLPIWNMYGNI